MRERPPPRQTEKRRDMAFDACHCSTKITVNSVVIAKSMPVVSNGSTPPMNAPMIEPMIQ